MFLPRNTTTATTTTTTTSTSTKPKRAVRRRCGGSRSVPHRPNKNKQFKFVSYYYSTYRYMVAMSIIVIAMVLFHTWRIIALDFQEYISLSAPSTSPSDDDMSFYPQEDEHTRKKQPKQTKKKHYPEPTFLDPSELNDLDEFSAAWWMPRERFLQVDLESIQSVEGDVFIPLHTAGEGYDDARLTRDWLDFSVEHLSKWQKMIGNHAGNAMVEQICQKYVATRLERSTEKNISGSSSQMAAIRRLDTYMNTTLALIPYGVPDDASESVQAVWVGYLAATITSLVQHGVKRIVVVGYYDMDAILAAKALEMLLGNNHAALLGTIADRTYHHREFQLSSTELVYIHTTHVQTKHDPINVPFGALTGLQEEWKRRRNYYTSSTTSQRMDLVDGNGGSSLFLGSHTASDFDYAYFTEADQILHARLSPTFWKELDDNRIIIPHRLQPIPHADDNLAPLLLQEGLANVHYLPDHHAPVIDLQSRSSSSSSSSSRDEDDHACCDNPDHYGQKTCENFWWMCGYYDSPLLKEEGDSEGGHNFSHFDPFDFMRLSTTGTGIVTLAGNEHGRPCRVKLHGRGTCATRTSDGGAATATATATRIRGRRNG